MRAFMLAFGLFAAPAMAADQFDLVCKYGNTPVRYRIDVARGEACEKDCARVWPMGLVTSGEIRLLDVNSGDPTRPPETITINRQTGQLRHWIGGGASAYVETATCEPAPFSGFPASKF